MLFGLELFATLLDPAANRFVLRSMLDLVVLGTIAHGSAASA